MNPSSSWLRTFLIIFCTQAFSLLGSAAAGFVLVWWLTVETGSAVILAYASIALFLPQALVGPFAGPYIDRWDRRKTMIAADLALAALSLALMALFAASSFSVGAVIGFIALRSVATAFHLPASQAAVPMYVPAEQLTRVAGWSFFLQSGSAMAAPVLGALIFASLSVSWALALDVLGALIAATGLLLVRIPHPVGADGLEEAGDSVLRQMKTGWRVLVGHRGVLALALLLTASTFAWLPVNALFPLITLEHFGGTAWHAGVVEFAFGMGMLVGSVGIGILGGRIPGMRLISLGLLIMGAMLIAGGLLPGSAFWVFTAVCAVIGFSAPLFSAPTMALFQSLVDPAVLGRVLSLVGTMAILASPAGLLAAGPGAEWLGPPVWFAFSGILLLLIGVCSLLAPALKELARPETPLTGSEAMAATAAPAVAPPTAGPAVAQATAAPAVAGTPGD